MASTYVLTNHRDMELVKVLMVHARRRRIEKKRAEPMDFLPSHTLAMISGNWIFASCNPICSIVGTLVR
ncbi:MAG: hypothetical protein C4527_16915 [Candidatus Omnitrophota bacterium]|nr:MAG: hypothetical protein C4527_16915 [Candidatus Omnitrophota bacterium]